jgi:hypothetical protein
LRGIVSIFSIGVLSNTGVAPQLANNAAAAIRANLFFIKLKFIGEIILR